MHLPTFTLLIVEDLATHRELYRHTLSQDSSCVYQVLEAESVTAGLELCRTRSIDGILLDYGLPDDDGLVFLAALATQTNGSSPPVVMLTGRGDERIAVRAMKLGVEDYLVKGNLTPALLQSTMRSAILQGKGSANKNTRFRRQLPQSPARSVALLQSEQRFNAIFQQTCQLMGLVSIDGILLEVNQAALNSIGAPESQIVGKYFWDAPWWHTEQLQQQIKAAIATAASGQFIRYEVAFPNPNGGVSMADFSLKPIFDAVGRVESIVAEAHDITEQQAALREHRQAQADLEQRNQELDSFVYVVSHDLKAPLRGITNLSLWIEEDSAGSLSVANQQQMALLRSRVNKMQATIDGLLEYARSGQADEKLLQGNSRANEPVSIAELLAEVIEQIAPPRTFAIELPPELPILATRRLPLFQVFANLIGNGIKHHDRLDGSIRISYQERDNCYEFAIADDGPGIAPEHHDRMFKIFQAVNPQNRPDSTGIGLAIVKKIVEAEGGTIWLESQLGQGTTFYFTWLDRVILPTHD